MRTVLVVAAVGLGLGLGLGGGRSAVAQQVDRVVVTSSYSSSGPGAGSALTRETVERMGELLELDELQREVAFELFKDMSDRRQALGDALRQDVDRARELAEDGDMTRMFARMKEVTAAHQDAVAELERTYLQDLRTMLAGEQEAAWPGVERLHRRTQHMGSLTRSQARVDLDDLVREQFADAYAREDVAEVLERWAVQVDGLLVERARKAADIGGGANFRGGVFIMDGQDDPYEPLRAIDARVLSASEQAVRTLGGVLEDDSIERAWVRTAFARVYRQTDGERRLEAAVGLGSLTDDQKDQLEAVAEQHGRDAEAARARWVAAEKEREADTTMPPGMVVFVTGQEPTPSDLARDAVKELDARLEAKLESILDGSQLAELPAVREAAEEFPMPPGGGALRSIRIGG